MTTHNPKFRGTPGPWRVDGHEHKNAEVLRNNPRPIPEHRVEANARLLAAAPDLLAALESLVETFDPDRQVIYSFARGKIEAAKHAIEYIYQSNRQ